MNHLIKVLSIVCCFIATSALAAPAGHPKSIEVHYDVTKNGQPFAHVKEQFIITGNTYKLESITKGIGVYALFGERKLTSTGEVTDQGLKPNHFELQQGNNPNKALIADFEWEKNNLHMSVKGSPLDAELKSGTQDLASFGYQFMFIPTALKGRLEVVLTTGKKLNQYVYEVSAPQKMDIAGKSYQTLHLVPPVDASQTKETTETKELWLGVDQHYVPVRILIVDDNGQKLEQNLTEFNAN